MKSSIFLTLALVATLLSATPASAAMYRFDYDFLSGETLSVSLIGELQADNDTILVDQVLDSFYSGDPLLQFTTELLGISPTVTFSGQGISIGTKGPGGPLGTGLGGWLIDFPAILDGINVARPDDGGPEVLFLESETFLPANWNIKVVPLPTAVWLFGSALGLLGWLKRRAA